MSKRHLHDAEEPPCQVQNDIPDGPALRAPPPYVQNHLRNVLKDARAHLPHLRRRYASSCEARRGPNNNIFTDQSSRVLCSSTRRRFSNFLHSTTQTPQASSLGTERVQGINETLCHGYSIRIGTRASSDSDSVIPRRDKKNRWRA